MGIKAVKRLSDIDVPMLVTCNELILEIEEKWFIEVCVFYIRLVKHLKSHK